jgi:hypothetical protein
MSTPPAGPTALTHSKRASRIQSCASTFTTTSLVPRHRKARQPPAAANPPTHDAPPPTPTPDRSASPSRCGLSASPGSPSCRILGARVYGRYWARRVQLIGTLVRAGTAPGPHQTARRASAGSGWPRTTARLTRPSSSSHSARSRQRTCTRERLGSRAACPSPGLMGRTSPPRPGDAVENDPPDLASSGDALR